jgi:PAS domain S-box-containing protein
MAPRKKLLPSAKLPPTVAETGLHDLPTTEQLARKNESLVHELQVYQLELEMQNESLRLSQQALEESRDKFRELFEFAPVAYLTLTLDGMIEQANLTMVSFLGYERSRLIKRNLINFVSNRDQDRWSIAFRLLRNVASDKRLDLTFRRADGTLFEAQVDCIVQPTSIWVSLTDVSERNRQIMALQNAETRWVNAVEGAGDGIWEWEISSDRMLRTTLFDAHLGYRDGELPMTATAWLALIHPDDLEESASRIQNYLAGKTPSYQMEMRVRRKDGQYQWLLCRGTIVERDEHGQPSRMLGIHSDITLQKSTENELRNTSRNLEQLVAERTAQLHNITKLLTLTEDNERRRLAQYLHDDLCQLLAVIKIKLTSIDITNRELLLDDVVGLVDLADTSVREITKQLHPAPLAKLGLLAGFQMLIEEMDQYYGLKVLLHTEGTVQILSEEITSILFRSVRELLINVSKHAKVHTVMVDCLWQKNGLLLEVTDSGVGFKSKVVLDLLSFPHFGLIFVRERILAIGGAIDIVSHPNQGTQIKIMIPYDFLLKEEKND